MKWPGLVGAATGRVVVVAGLCMASFAHAQPEQTDLLDLSLEDLMKVEVTTASRRPEALKDVPAAITVLTQNDIRRSGATSIPDALGLIPGVHAARLDGHQWSVTTRGFGGQFANKLLVLVDGVSIYSPLFSGTFWEVENVLLEDIDRIEVISGPNGASWGANAVNGVINIITKDNKETVGGMVRIGSGTNEPARLALRYGEQLSEKFSYRVSSQYFYRDGHRYPDGGDANDANQGGNLQLRLQWQPNAQDEVTVIGKVARFDADTTYSIARPLPPYSAHQDDTAMFEHGNLLLRWKRTYDERDILRVRAYVDYWRNSSAIINDTRRIADVEVSRHLPLGVNHEVVLGGQVRYMWDSIGSRYAEFSPDSSSETTYSVHGQLHLAAVPDKLKLMLGTRIEHNDYTGIEVEPTARLIWSPREQHNVWAAVSRAVRVPARGETDIFLPSFSGPGFVAALKGDDLESETLNAYEVGYRYFPSSRFSLDFNLFLNDYDHLRTIELGMPYLRIWEDFPTLVLPFYPRNNLEARAVGGSAMLDWRPADWWRIRAGYAYADFHLTLQAESFAIFSDLASGDNPTHSAVLWNSFDISKRINLDVLLNYTDKLPALDVDDYLALRVRLAWQLRENMELAITGNDLLDSSRLEYRSSLVNSLPSELQRGVYAEFTWNF